MPENLIWATLSERTKRQMWFVYLNSGLLGDQGNLGNDDAGLDVFEDLTTSRRSLSCSCPLTLVPSYPTDLDRDQVSPFSS